MDDAERLKVGKEMFKKVYGNVLELPEKPTAFSEQSLKQLFAEVYTRPGLSMRDRRLLILGALTGLGADPGLFDIHARSGVENGEFKAQELEEFLLLLVHYCGFPKTAVMLGVASKIIEEKKGKSKKKKKKGK
jgi:4-carboxymuconolactone decarboxylase